MKTLKIDLSVIITAIYVILKLTNVIECSWLMVLSPIIIRMTLRLLTYIIAIIMTLVK